MTECMLEFVVVGQVSGSELLQEPYRTLIGQCGNAAIRVGDHFDAIAQYDEPKTLADYARDPVEIRRDRVDLVVRHIRAYERDRDVLERGMTGSLVVVGTGLDKLRENCSLLASVSAAVGNGNRPQAADAEPATRIAGRLHT